MIDPRDIVPEGKPLPPNRTRIVTGAQLSSSGAHLSTTGSGIRQLFEKDSPVVATDVAVAPTEEVSRPAFAKVRKRS